MNDLEKMQAAKNALVELGTSAEVVDKFKMSALVKIYDRLELDAIDAIRGIPRG